MAGRGVMVSPESVSFQFLVEGESLTIMAKDEAACRKFRNSFYSINS